MSVGNKFGLLFSFYIFQVGLLISIFSIMGLLSGISGDLLKDLQIAMVCSCLGTGMAGLQLFGGSKP